MSIVPTIRPTKKQFEAWKELDMNNFDTKILGFGGGAGGGKTWLGCEWLLVNCYMFPKSRWFIAREELTRLKKSTYITFQKVSRHHKIPEEDWTLDGMNSVIKFKNGSTIDLIDVAFKPSDPNYERFGSLEYTGGFGEEAGEWNFDAFDILKSRIGRHNYFDLSSNSMCEKPFDYDLNPSKYPKIKELPPKFLLTFNPSRNWLYRIFYKPYKENNLLKGYKYIPVLYTENPYSARMYGEQLEGIHNKVNKARLKDGDWEYSDDISALTTLENLQDMFSNTITIRNVKYMTVDVARSGEDSTVITIWEDLNVKKIIKKTKQDTARTAQDVKDLASAYKIPYSHIAIDVINVGSGVVDQINGCVAFNSNSSPFLTKTEIRDIKKKLPNEFMPKTLTAYQNLKTQCAFKLAELINEHKIATNEVNIYRDEIIQDLTATLQERDMDKEGKKKIATKEDIKEELGRSPDVGDTFIMRMYFELKQEATDKDPEVEKHLITKQANRLVINSIKQSLNSAK